MGAFYHGCFNIFVRLLSYHCHSNIVDWSLSFFSLFAICLGFDMANYLLKSGYFSLSWTFYLAVFDRERVMLDRGATAYCQGEGRSAVRYLVSTDIWDGEAPHDCGASMQIPVPCVTSSSTVVRGSATFLWRWSPGSPPALLWPPSSSLLPGGSGGSGFPRDLHWYLVVTHKVLPPYLAS